MPNKRPVEAGEFQGSAFGGGAYTTGRRGGRGRAPPPPTSAPPGKLNIKDYTNVSNALGRLQVRVFWMRSYLITDFFPHFFLTMSVTIAAWFVFPSQSLHGSYMQGFSVFLTNEVKL